MSDDTMRFGLSGPKEGREEKGVFFCSLEARMASLKDVMKTEPTIVVCKSIVKFCKVTLMTYSSC